MLILVKLLAKYAIIIYALGSVHEKFGVWIKPVPKTFHSGNFRPGEALRTAEPFQIEIGVLVSAREKIGVWTGPKGLY